MRIFRRVRVDRLQGESRDSDKGAEGDRGRREANGEGTVAVAENTRVSGADDAGTAGRGSSGRRVARGRGSRVNNEAAKAIRISIGNLGTLNNICTHVVPETEADDAEADCDAELDALEVARQEVLPPSLTVI